MASPKAFLVAAIVGVAALGLSLSSTAQTAGQTDVIAAPHYGSDVSAGSLSNGSFNTPESDGRPGVKFFTYGVRAFKKGDYRHAIDMYKVAASWAYKPAEYNLGVMYFKGQGVPVNRARGAAWMVLAAERGDSQYVKARDLMVTLLSKAEFARTDELWGELKQTYGDEVALRRAKAQWALIKAHQTGTRVGGATGELSVGVLDAGRSPTPPPPSLQGSDYIAATSAALLQAGSIDGSLAYRQFRKSDNPYDPIFLKGRNGTATVEPLQQVEPRARRTAKPAGSAEEVHP
ncbi:MAG: tetratricopeptide repeat protein [Rhodanobacteraceae bacterium]